MKRFLRKLEWTVVFTLKAILCISLFVTFYGIYATENWQMLNLSRTSVIVTLTYVCVGILLLMIYGNYDIGKRKSKPIIYSVGLATVITDIIAYITLCIMNTNVANNISFEFEHPQLLLLIIFIQMILITAFAYGGNAIYFWMYQPEKSCIITSSKENVKALYNAIGKFKKQFRVAYIDDYKSTAVYEHIMHSDTVFIHDVPASERSEIIEFCYKNFKNIYFTPEIADVVQLNAKHMVLDDISLVAAPVKELTFEQRFLKRLTDIVISVIAIIVTSPIWLVCGIAIKAYDGGPVFFKQNRVTKNGKVFNVYKFRTMKDNNDNHSVTADDDRITPIGKKLRKYRIDELPQFINILKGEMSVVGPRPEMIENVYNYTNELPEFEYRLRVKAGLTGYAQVAGKYSTSPKDKLILDLMYIENYSYWKDWKYILLTLVVFFKKDSTEAFHDTKDIDWENINKL